MKNIKINTDIIKALDPCNDRFDNWLQYYSDFNKTLLEFLDLENISHSDKIWVALRLLPRHTVEVFAIDCVFAAYDAASVAYDNPAYADYYAASYAAADDASYAIYTPYPNYDSYATDSATSAVFAISANDASIERDRQIEALKYLIESEE